MDDLVQWLGEQLDEDERIARAAAGLQADPENGWGISGQAIMPHIGVVHEGEARAHIARYNPARVLSEIDAKRQAVRLYAEAVEGRAAVRAKMRGLMDDDCGEFERLHRQESELIEAEVRLRFVVLWLAQPYADRPGYREEWRP